MNTKLPIRFSTWTLTHKKFKKDVRVAKRVIVSGNEDDIPRIKNNSLYLLRAYRNIFGKAKAMKKMKEDQYIVTSVELNIITMGTTNVSSK